MTWPPIYALFQSAAILSSARQTRKNSMLRSRIANAFSGFLQLVKTSQIWNFWYSKRILDRTLLDMGLFALRAEGVCETSVLVVYWIKEGCEIHFNVFVHLNPIVLDPHDFRFLAYIFCHISEISLCIFDCIVIWTSFLLQQYYWIVKWNYNFVF